MSPAFRRLTVACLTALALAAAPAAHAAPPFLAAWGSGGSGPGQLDTADGLAMDSAGRLFVADRGNNRVQLFLADGTFVASWSAGFNQPFGVAVDDRGAVYVIDNGNNRVVELDLGGAVVRTWGGKGVGDGQFNDPRGIGVGPDGTVYVADHGNNRVEAFTADGSFLRKWGRNGGDGSAGSGPGEFDQPRGVSADAAGNVFVVEKRNNRVQEFTPGGRFLNAFGGLGVGPGQLSLPYSAAIDPSGNVYVTEVTNQRISEFSPAGAFLAKFGHNGGDGTAGGGPGEFRGPYGVATDCRGGVYVSDEENNRIQRFADPAAALPRCAPAVTVGAVHAGRSGATLQAMCDRACSLYATARVAVDGGKPVALKAGAALMPARPDRLELRYSHGLRRALGRGRGRRLVVRVVAAGLGGMSAAMVRTVRL